MGPIIHALKEIRYAGDLSLEAHNFAKKLPEELIPAAMAYAYAVAVTWLRGSEWDGSGQVPGMETEGGYKRTAKSLLLILLSVMVAAEGALAAAQEDRPGRTTFQDVPSNFWAKEAITFAIQNN